jgi:hypothetical protein
MTSVPNHPLPLSGNNRIQFLTAFILLLSSCALLQGSKPVQPSPEKPKEVVKSEKQTPLPKEDVTAPLPKTNETVWFYGDRYEVANRKRDLKVAVILPFQSEERLADIMFEYYLGLKEAFLEIETDDVNFKLIVYSISNDSASIARLLFKQELKSADAIIGPIGDVAMNLVSSFGLKHKIPVFSPFSPVDQLSQPNPLFFNLNTDRKSKATAMASFLKRNYPKAKFIIVRDGKKYDKEFVPVLMAELDKQKIAYTKVNFGNFNSWATYLSGEQNLVYVPTTEKNVVSVTLGNIFSVKKNVIILGEYKWVDLVNNDYKFWETLNVHLVGTSFVDYHDSTNYYFRLNYRNKYLTDPGEYAHLGYAQGRFLSEAMSAFGTAFPMYISGKSFAYNGSCFQFSAQNGIRYNNHLWILKYQDHKLTPLSP